MSECYREVSIMKRHWPIRGCCTMGGGEGERKIILKHNTNMTEFLQTHNGTAMFLLTYNNATSVFLHATLVRLCSVTWHCCDVFLPTHNTVTV
jgi:hypothetical protein